MTRSLLLMEFSKKELDKGAIRKMVSNSKDEQGHAHILQIYPDEPLAPNEESKLFR